VSPDGITVGKPDNTVSFSNSSESPHRLLAPQRRLHFFFCDESELSSEPSSTTATNEQAHYHYINSHHQHRQLQIIQNQHAVHMFCRKMHVGSPT